MKRIKLINILYMLFFASVIYLFIYGSSYYTAPIAQKVRHALHPLLRQSGTLGHLLGILGSIFMILLLLYSIRKRFRFAQKMGNLNTWLQVHIFLGITGPVLILFHTVFKFSGIVSIAFWSMVLVVASGIIGKYIYELIPRSLSGMELNRIELEAEEIGLTFEIRKLIPADHIFWKYLSNLESKEHKPGLLEPLLLYLEPLKLHRIFHPVMKEFERNGLDKKKRKRLMSLLIKRRLIHRKALVLQQTLKILHYWHLLHKPFVIIMFLILMIHVYVSIKMGYAWIF